MPALSPELHPGAYAELFRVGRRIRDSGKQVVGLLPVGETVSVVPLAIHLAIALTHSGVRPINVLDANTTNPALSTLLEVRDGAVPRLVQTPIAEDVSVTTLAGPPSPVPMNSELQKNIALGRKSCAHILMDLTGFYRLGHGEGAAEWVDALLIVARANDSREEELLRIHSLVPPEQNLGVLLTG